MRHDAAGFMARSFWWLGPVVALLITLLGGCEKQPRAREREAAEDKAKQRAYAAEAARIAALPLPEEPPIEIPRVPNSGLPCRVDEVFASKCRRCHTVPTRHGAPFVFLTWEDTHQDRLGQPLYAVIGRAVRTNFMPQRIEANPPVQPLSDDEKKIILDWVDAGAPREDCDPNAPEPHASAAKSPKAAPSASSKSKR
jgi:hypothetical protein